MGPRLFEDMGAWDSKVKGIGLMILEFCYQLFNVVQPRSRRVLLGFIIIVFASAAIPPVAKQIVKSSFAAHRPVLMILGDSLVAGHGLPQGEAFPDILGRMLKNDGFNARIINSGVSGDTTAGGLARLDWSLADNPDAAIIVLGGNDLLRGLDPSASYTNLNNIIERLKARNIAVLLAGMKAPRNLGADYANEFDAIYQRLASRHNVLFYPFFLDGVALQPMMNLADGMHPNEAGISHIAIKILPHVKRLLSRMAE